VDFVLEVIYHLHPMLSNQLGPRNIIASGGSLLTRWQQAGRWSVGSVLHGWMPTL